MGLLDPRFDYIPAAATDVAATWRRFGFDPRANQERRARANQERRARLGRRVSDVTANDGAATPTIRALVRVRA